MLNPPSRGVPHGSLASLELKQNRPPFGTVATISRLLTSEDQQQSVTLYKGQMISSRVLAVDLVTL